MLNRRLAAGVVKDYAIGDELNSQFTVTATDADGYMASKTIEILRNRQPIATEDSWGIYTIGSQDAKNARMDVMDQPGLVCTNFNACKVMVLETQFTDDNRGDLIYLVVTNSDPSRLSASVDGGEIVLVGLGSTWNEDKLTRSPDDAESAKGDHDDVELLIRSHR